MFFIARGNLNYEPKEVLRTSIHSKRSENGKETISLAHVTVVAEAALWVKDWLNQGTLTAVADSFVMSVEVADLATVLIAYKRAYARVAAYARQFIDELRGSLFPSDLIMVQHLHKIEIEEARISQQSTMSKAWSS